MPADAAAMPDPGPPADGSAAAQAESPKPAANAVIAVKLGSRKTFPILSRGWDAGEGAFLTGRRPGPTEWPST